jgi:hypothetical protein
MLGGLVYEHIISGLQLGVASAKSLEVSSRINSLEDLILGPIHRHLLTAV